ncbi:hypothetical protein MCOR01_011610 [Pyricularia oryzae]|nr:hypothetical protein MCOR01_011610 [Pyricularia oryzae]
MRTSTFVKFLSFAISTMALPTPRIMSVPSANAPETSLDDSTSRLAARDPGYDCPSPDHSDDDSDDDDEDRYRVYDPDDPSTHRIEDVD